MASAERPAAAAASPRGSRGVRRGCGNRDEHAARPRTGPRGQADPRLRALPPGRRRLTRACAQLRRWVAVTSVLSSAEHAADEFKRLDLYAATLEIDSFLDESRHRRSRDASRTTGKYPRPGISGPSTRRNGVGLPLRRCGASGHRPSPRGLSELAPAYGELLDRARRAILPNPPRYRRRKSERAATKLSRLSVVHVITRMGTRGRCRQSGQTLQMAAGYQKATANPGTRIRTVPCGGARSVPG